MEVKDSLEKWVVEYQAAGQDWVKAKLLADQLSEGQKNFLAHMINTWEAKAAQSIDQEQRKMSEAKLERLARGSAEFIRYTDRMCLAVSDMLSRRVRYDAMDKWYEAKRSGLSFEKELLRKGIFDGKPNIQGG